MGDGRIQGDVGGNYKRGKLSEGGHIGEKGVFESRSILFRGGLGERGILVSGGSW